MSRAWEAAGHGVLTGQSVSRVLLFLAGDRTFTSPVYNPTPRTGIWQMEDVGRRRRIGLGSGFFYFSVL